MGVQNLAIFTIGTNSYVAGAKVLLQSVRRHHPDATFYFCAADRLLPDAGFYPPDCLVIAAEALGIAEFSEFAFRYDAFEFSTALKPFMLRHVLQRGHDAVLYFDADIEVFAPLDGILTALGDGAAVVLTPHLLQPAEGDSMPDDVGILRAGIYNLGFIGVRNCAGAAAVVDWWARRLRYQCVVDPDRSLVVDQRFIDLVPGFLDRVHILRLPQYNVAYWNLAQRGLEQYGEEWRVGGERLRFFHFSGFDCGQPEVLSKHTTAYRNDRIAGPLRALIRHHVDELVLNGYHEASQVPYAFGYFASGTPISPDARKVFRVQYVGWSGDPFAYFKHDVPLLGPMPRTTTPDEMMAAIEAIHASTSWRITRPLRAVKRWLGGLT
jgi:hypothetical protein